MRSIFIVFAALIAVTQAVSSNLDWQSVIGRSKSLKRRAQTTAQKQIESSTKLFSQQNFGQRIPKGKLTKEDKDKVYKDFGFAILDANGDHRISFDEAISQIPQEWRSPDFIAQLRR